MSEINNEKSNNETKTIQKFICTCRTHINLIQKNQLRAETISNIRVK